MVEKHSAKQAKALICEGITIGKSLAQVLREDEAMPVAYTVFRWLSKDEAFRAEYARAREAQADADADAIGDIATRVIDGKLDPQAARVAIDALKWTAARRQPKKYGDRVDMNVSGGIVIEGAEVRFVGDSDA